MNTALCLRLMRPAARRGMHSRATMTTLPCSSDVARPRISRSPLSKPQRRQMSFMGNYFGNLRQVYHDQMRQNPVLFPFAVMVVVLSCGGLVYASYLHVKVRREMGNYPENVGLKLRRAIYFTDHNPDPAQAMKAYVGAIKLAQEEKMHPMSEEVLGIYLQMARFLEKTGNVKGAVEVLENSRLDCLKWIEEHVHDEDAVEHRSRLLQRSIQIAHKIGELYSSPYYPDKQKAEEYLVWAVQTALRENKRRAEEGLKPGEGEIISRDQQGASLEALGHHYEELDNHYYAAQLFLQALAMKTKTDCHTVILMNNIAASLAQQVPLPEPGVPPPSPEQLRESGRAWAKRALELGRSLQPPARDGECDVGCAVATHNLAEFAEMDGFVKEARELYEEAGSLAHAIGFTDGVAASDAALLRLSKGRKIAPRLRNAKSSTKNWW